MGECSILTPLYKGGNVFWGVSNLVCVFYVTSGCSLLLIDVGLMVLLDLFLPQDVNRQFFENAQIHSHKLSYMSELITY